MDEDKLGFWGYFLIIAIAITCCLIPSWALMWRNIQNEPAVITIGQEAPATPSPVFNALVERAKAAATVEIIRAEAEASSQAVDDEIKLAWNLHFMRRFWAWYILIPILAIVAGGTVALVGYVRRESSF